MSPQTRANSRTCWSCTAAAAAVAWVLLLCSVPRATPSCLDEPQRCRRALSDRHTSQKQWQQQQQHVQAETSAIMLPPTDTTASTDIRSRAIVAAGYPQPTTADTTQQQYQSAAEPSAIMPPPAEIEAASRLQTAVKREAGCSACVHSRPQLQQQQSRHDNSKESAPVPQPTKAAPAHTAAAAAAAAHVASAANSISPLDMQQQQQRRRRLLQLQSGSIKRRRLSQVTALSQSCALGQGCCGSGAAVKIGIKDSKGVTFVATAVKRPPRSQMQRPVAAQLLDNDAARLLVTDGSNDTVTDDAGDTSTPLADDDVSAQQMNSSSSSDNSSISISDSPSNATGNSSSSGDGTTLLGVVTPAAVCANDAAFISTTASRTTCRFFANFWERGSSVTYTCTAWFVSPTLLVTAGHCVSDGDGSYGLDTSDPGFVCCGFMYDTKQDRMVCNPALQFNVTKWVTTVGWYQKASSHNDGAVLEVVPADSSSSSSSSMKPVPQQLGSYYSNSGRWRAVPTQPIYLDGYPGADPGEQGCSSLNITTRYQSLQPKAKPLDGSGVEGTVVYYAVSGCQGMSGGRVLRNNDRGQAFAIQTRGDPFCDEYQRGMTEVTQIVRKSSTDCGVCVPCLMSALNKENSAKPRSAAPDGL